MVQINIVLSQHQLLSFMILKRILNSILNWEKVPIILFPVGETTLEWIAQYKLLSSTQVIELEAWIFNLGQNP